MAKPLADSEALRLDEHRRALSAALGRLEAAYVGRHVRVADVHLMYEAALLSFHTELEARIEAVVLGLLLRRLRVGGESIAPRIAVPTKPLALAVLRGDRDFVDWMPLKKTEDRVPRLLRGTWPDGRLDQGDRATLATLSRVRNAVAHRSTEALDRFRSKDLPSGSPPAHRRPAVFLRAGHGSPGGSNLESLMAGGAVALRKLCAAAP
jgi:hypothetical protein